MTHDYSNTVIPDQIWTVEELERFRASIIEECAMSEKPQALRDEWKNQSLRNAERLMRNAVIEDCAQVLESAFAECSTLNLLHGAARVRALKGQGCAVCDKDFANGDEIIRLENTETKEITLAHRSCLAKIGVG